MSAANSLAMLASWFVGAPPGVAGTRHRRVRDRSSVRQAAPVKININIICEVGETRFGGTTATAPFAAGPTGSHRLRSKVGRPTSVFGLAGRTLERVPFRTAAIAPDRSSADATTEERYERVGSRSANLNRGGRCQIRGIVTVALHIGIDNGAPARFREAKR